MQKLPFHIELYNETPYPDATFEEEARKVLAGLCEGYTDITGTAIAVEELTGSETPHVYQVRVILYMRPEDIVVVEKAPKAVLALSTALDTIERLVREQRDRLRETWKQP